MPMTRPLACVLCWPCLAAALAAAADPQAEAQALGDRVGALDSELKAFLGRHPKREVEWNSEGDRLMKESNSLVEALTAGTKTEAKKHLLERVIGDLEQWQTTTAARLAEGKKHLVQTDADFLMKILVQRKHLPMATQLAALKRKDVGDVKWAKLLLANHTDKVPLCEQLEGLLSQENVKSKVKSGLPSNVGHDEKVREEKVRRVKESMAGMAAGLSETVEELARLVDPKDPEATKELAQARAWVQQLTAKGVGKDGQRTLTIPERLHLMKTLGDELKRINRRTVASRRKGVKKAA